jgi:hypothetical protein
MTASSSRNSYPQTHKSEAIDRDRERLAAGVLGYPGREIRGRVFGGSARNVELDCLAVLVVRAWRPSRLDGVELRER